MRQESPAPTAQVTPDEGRELSTDPLYGVAMLKIAMELKKAPKVDLDQILRGVLARMRLPEDEFRSFLARNGGLLRSIAARRGY